MDTVVVKRVLEYGRKEDYYAMLQLYGGFEKVGEIVMRIPVLNPKEAEWGRRLFNLDKEKMLCYKRQRSKNRLIIF